jgi:hypothetical protein
MRSYDLLQLTIKESNGHREECNTIDDIVTVHFHMHACQGRISMTIFDGRMAGHGVVLEIKSRHLQQC